MKKILLALLILIFSLSFISADDTVPPEEPPIVEPDPVDLRIPADGNAFGSLLKPYQPLTARVRGMGTTGVAVTGRSDTFYVNPAALASKRLQISAPSVQLTAYHLYDAVKGGGDLFSLGSLVNMASGIQEGYGRLLDLDAAMSFTVGGFGLGINTTFGVNTFADNGRYGLQSDLFGELRAAISLGYGYRFELPMDFSIDVGAMVRFNYLAFTDVFSAELLSDMDNFDISQQYVMAGFAIPFDIGINVNMPYGFSFGLVSRNMNGRYYMTQHSGFEAFGSDPFGGKADDSMRFSFDTDWSLDAGFGWSYDTWYLSPTVAIDFRDLVGMCTTDDFTFRDFMYHLNIGAEVRVLSFLDIRAGLSQGYWSLGLGLDLWAFKVDVAYYRQEFGDTAGSYGLDGFTVRINLGYDR